MGKPELTITLLQQEAKVFGQQESQHDEPKLYGITDGSYRWNLFRA